MELNRDEKSRDIILFGKYNPDEYSGGIRHFSNLDIDTMNKLVEDGFVDITDMQNNSPTIKHFMLFAERWKQYNVTLHGYVVSANRGDYRLSIEGCETTCEESLPKQLTIEFVNSFREADSFILHDKRVYCWYD